MNKSKNLNRRVVVLLTPEQEKDASRRAAELSIQGKCKPTACDFFRYLLEKEIAS